LQILDFRFQNESRLLGTSDMIFWGHGQVGPVMDNRPSPLEVCGNLAERLNGCGLVFFYVENGVQLGDLEQVVDLLGQVQ
jgi:hypothetical protein